MFSTLLPRLSDFLQRVGSYPAWEVAVEFAIIWIVVWAIVRFVQGTRAAGALKGLLLLLIIATVFSRVLAGAQTFHRLGILYDRFLALVAVGLIVIFQPELRRALVRLGEAPLFRGGPSDISIIVDELTEACRYFSKAKFGAIIVLERQVGLGGLAEGGTTINATLTARLLQTIFFPGSALHDLAVIVKGKVVTAAGVQLPLADPSDMPDPSLGSRHRAAVGLSKECDALVIVVSEESGRIRLAERGTLTSGMSPDDFEQELRRRLQKHARVTRHKPATPPATTAAEAESGQSMMGLPVVELAPDAPADASADPARATDAAAEASSGDTQAGVELRVVDDGPIEMADRPERPRA